MKIAAASSLTGVIAGVPRLPAVVRYYDDFSDAYIEVRDLASTDEWDISYDGMSAKLTFVGFDSDVKAVIKSWFGHSLGTLSPRTVHGYHYAIRKLEQDDLRAAVLASPQDIRSVWKQLHSRSAYYSLQALQNLLSFCCRCRIARWTSEYEDLISQLGLPKRDKYSSVRVGDVFLRIEEESLIVDRLDTVSTQLRNSNNRLDDGLLEVAGMLLCSYQFGFRPKQIALLEKRNLRIWNDGLDLSPAVHLNFTMIKQRSAGRVFQMVRRVKPDWSPIFVELSRRMNERGASGGDKLFSRNPREVASDLADHLEQILGERRTATELRHTAAQRLVDAGASEEELAGFMGHTDLNTGLPYFTASPSQGERINRALGLSGVYTQVAQIAHQRFISTEELIALKGDQQVAGVPHGIPIAGIGGCSSGQPACPYNPVLSCYGCRRFMPLSDVRIHRQVLEDLRGVLKIFYVSSRAERGSPAFQLEDTLAKVQAVITELEGESIELLP